MRHISNGRESLIGKSASGIHKASRKQTTLGHRVTCSGIGIHSGREVRMALSPAPAGTGIFFHRTDLTPAAEAEGADCIAARYDSVVDTRLGTTLANAAGTQVATVEHLMAAFAALGVDNARVDIDGPEVPIMDGSAAPFVFLIECAGLRRLPAARTALRVLEPVVVEEEGRMASLSPHDGFSIDLEIEFASAAVRRQRFRIDLSEASFKSQLSRARTFGFLEEVEFLRDNGLAQGGSLDNCVVVDGDIILNEEGLRFGDEFVRHKVLDVVGDLSLAGLPIKGRFTGVCSGHQLNNALLRELMARPTAYEVVRLSDAVAKKASRARPAALPVGLTATA